MKLNWKAPLPKIVRPVRVGGVTGAALCVTGMVWPSKVILAVRLVVRGLAVKAKLTTPLMLPVMVSQSESLTGVNGPVKLAVAGNTRGNASLPAAAVSAFAVGSTKAWGSSLIALLP
jgi:hypothetical protein